MKWTWLAVSTESIHMLVCMSWVYHRHYQHHIFLQTKQFRSILFHSISFRLDSSNCDLVHCFAIASFGLSNGCWVYHKIIMVLYHLSFCQCHMYSMDMWDAIANHRLQKYHTHGEREGRVQYKSEFLQLSSNFTLIRYRTSSKPIDGKYCVGFFFSEWSNWIQYYCMKHLKILAWTNIVYLFIV